MKSLLHLLIAEDQAAKELEARTYGLEKLKRQKVRDEEILGFQMEIIEDARRRFADARKEVREYLVLAQAEYSPPDEIETFMRMLMEEARRDSLVERCAEWGIDELEMTQCVNYLEESLDIDSL